MLAALRLYQQTPEISQPIVQTTNFGPVFALDKQGIDALCESIDHAGLEFAQITPLFGKDGSNPFVAAALDLVIDGEVEVDVPAVVSESEEGAYSAHRKLFRA